MTTDPMPTPSGGTPTTTTTPRVTWFNEHVDITRGFLLSCIVVGFAFIGFSIWGAIYVVNDLRLQDCEAVNDRRREAAEVARADVDADRLIWQAIDDLLESGIPDPARTIIFDQIDARDALIVTVYGREMCA